MTGGRVVSLGPVGRNIAAGMTGGVLFLHDADMSVKAHISDSAPSPRRLGSADAAELRTMIEAHVASTGSIRGAELLSDWETAVTSFWVLRPSAPMRQEESRTESQESRQQESGSPLSQS